MSGWTLGHEGHQPLPSKGVLVDANRSQVTLSSQAKGAIGVRAEEVTVGEVAATLVAYAESTVPWQRKALGSAQISGRITKLLVRPGDMVHEGDPIAEVSSRELEKIKLDYLQAKKDLSLKRELLASTKPAAQSGAIPMQRLVELEIGCQQSELSLMIAQLRSQTLGVPVQELERQENEIRHLLRAPITGTIVHSDLFEGKYVEAYEHLFEVVDNSETWVRIQLLEKDAFRVEVGHGVEVEFPDLGAKQQGTIERISPTLEPNTKVVWAWTRFTDPAILPGLVGVAKIKMLRERERLSIPAKALHSDGLQHYVFVELASTKSSSSYAKRYVALGGRVSQAKESSSRYLEVASGDLYPGDRVVVQGGHELSSLFFLEVLKLRESDRERLGIRTMEAAKRPISQGLRLPATVLLPPERRAVASSQLAGTIRSHRLFPGMPVRRGDLLMEISSQAFFDLQLELLRTRLEADLARKQSQNLQSLSNEALVRRLYLETMAKAEQLEQQIESLQRQLLAIGLDEQEIHSILRQQTLLQYLPIRSPIDGQLAFWNGTLGKTIAPNESLVEIQNLEQVWVEAYVPARDMHWVTLQSSGRASVLSNPDVKFPVAVMRVGPLVDEGTRTRRIWLTPSSLPSNGTLRDGVQLSLTLKTREDELALTVPVTAILRDGVHSFVFIQKEDGYIDRRRVTTGRDDGEWIELIQGVAAGERVVFAGGRELQTAYASLR